MTVANILKVKGRAVFSVKPAETLMDASRLLAEKRVGAVVATDESMNVLGILSERDIIRAIVGKGPDVLNAPVAEYMTTKVQTVTEATPVVAVMDMMTKGRFRHVPVVEGDRCVAVISIVDIVKHRVREIEFEHEALHSYIARTA